MMRGSRFRGPWPAALLAGLLLFIQASAWAVNPVLLVVGDSLSAAYGLQEKQGWVQLLRDRLAKRTPAYDVVNASISGDTTSGGVARIDAALQQYRPSRVIIELGANDGLRGLPIDATRANLETMVQAVKKAGAQVLLVGIELPPNYGPVFTQRFAQMFSDVAKKYKVPLVPSLLGDFGAKRELFQADNIHPVAEAQPMMMATVWKALQPLL